MTVTLPEVEAAYAEINAALREGRKPDLSRFTEEIQDYVRKDPVMRPTFWGQQLYVSDAKLERSPFPKKEAK